MAGQDTAFHHRSTIVCRGKLLDLSIPKVMGILNITPDSFHDGGRYISIQQAMDQAMTMHERGASIIDIGGASSRPGSYEVAEEEEAERVLPVIEALIKEDADLVLSIDTYRASIADQAAQAGISIINDISGGTADERMMETVGRIGLPFICMHRKGTSDVMQNGPKYSQVVKEVTEYFSERLVVAKNSGVTDVILDPGFGFGKTVEHNYQMIHHLAHFRLLEAPLMVGVSRKSMISAPLGIRASESLNGTTALHMACLQKGASILRVHDVKEAVECVKLYQLIQENALE